MPYRMQLIPATLLIIVTLLLLCAIHLLWLWHRLWRREELLSLRNNNIGHYGISLISAYPSTLQPLLAMVEEGYPRSEAILLCDMQLHFDRFGEVVRRFSLVRVNHDHLEGVRALYRSRQRAYRRVVVVDLPLEERSRSEAVAREVASYEYMLYIEGDTIIEPDTAALCIATIASYPIGTPISLSSLMGEAVEVRMTDAQTTEHHTIAHALAWREGHHLKALPLTCLVAPLIVVAGGTLWPYIFALHIATITTLLYISCRITSQKNLFIRFDTILLNFCRFIVDNIKRFCYLYKRGNALRHRVSTTLWRHPKSVFQRNNLRQL